MEIASIIDDGNEREMKKTAANLFDLLSGLTTANLGCILNQEVGTSVYRNALMKQRYIFVHRFSIWGVKI